MFVSASLSAPSLSGISATTSASGGSGSEGLSKGDIAGIVIGTVAVTSLIIFGAAYLFLRHKKLKAGVGATDPHAGAISTQPPSDGHGDGVRADIPPWPVETNGNHGNYELSHWVPQELDGAEKVIRPADGDTIAPGPESTVVSPISPINDNVERPASRAA